MDSRHDNGDGHPADGGRRPDGLPGLPPEWGVVVVPDDASALADETRALRRELTRTRRRERLLRLVPGGRRAGLVLPVFVLAVAVLATLSSFLLVVWPGTLTRQGSPRDTAAPRPRPSSVPDVTLTDGAGRPVQLRDSLPAVVLLVGDCDCAALVAGTANATPAGIRVLAVDRTVPAVPPGSRALALADPTGRVANLVSSWPATSGTATVVFVRRDGTLQDVLPAVTTVDQVRPDLARLN
jgi:hypothetical protein